MRVHQTYLSIYIHRLPQYKKIHIVDEKFIKGKVQVYQKIIT